MRLGQTGATQAAQVSTYQKSVLEPTWVQGSPTAAHSGSNSIYCWKGMGKITFMCGMFKHHP